VSVESSGPARIPYLDGLRGLSIIIVLVNHSGNIWPVERLPWWASCLVANGELGVRIFFAISGFLITQLLLTEEASIGKIDLRRFYGRRIARIFPVFYLFLLVVLLGIWIGTFRIGGAAFAAAGLYLWNYRFLFPIGEQGSNEILLGHLWSLSMEEQFYLIWPWLLPFIPTSGRLRVIVIALAVAPLLRLAFHFMLPTSRVGLVSMFHTGYDQIGYGVLAALVIRSIPVEKLKLRLPFKATLPILVLGIWLSGAIEVLSHGLGVLFGPVLAGVSVAGLLLWLFTYRPLGASLLLENAVLRWVGLVSYSVYLWQQLLLVWPTSATFLGPVMAWPAVFGLSAISYYIIEQPSRRWLRKIFRV